MLAIFFPFTMLPRYADDYAAIAAFIFAASLLSAADFFAMLILLVIAAGMMPPCRADDYAAIDDA